MAIVPKPNANANADNDAQQQQQQGGQQQQQQQQQPQPPPTAVSNLQTPATPTAPTAPSGIVLSPPPLRSKTRSMSIANKTYEKSFKQSQGSVGLFVTNELETAIERCKAKVQQTARICRMRNHKFRDPEFDISLDKDLCLKGLDAPKEEKLEPADIMRVTEIWDDPKFFIDGPSSSDVVQGILADCWFLSALANVACVPGLLEKICVARDEVVGVYGFIFFRDDSWVDVIIDDQLFVRLPKFESLSPAEQRLYHADPDLYNAVARKGNKVLYFARSKQDGETWVPLIEKAYAKLHGNYAYISQGRAMEGIEDLTGGVCTSLSTVDILDTRRLWKELLHNGNQSRLYSCSLHGLNDEKSEDAANRIHGLITGHAYTVLRAAEYKGKQFVVIRNPWGQGEWKGRWSDGSKEWTNEWLPALSVLGHSFGNDGQFVMEYSDFLKHWTKLDCTRLFDSSWVVSNMWIQVDGLTPLHPWTWGDISFTISVPQDTPSVIVLRQADKRYFDEISGWLMYEFDFVVYKKGSKEEYASSMNVSGWARSQNTEVYLQAGEYVVHVRLDTAAIRPTNYMEEGSAKWDRRVLKRLLARKAEAYAKAANFSATYWDDVIPMDLNTIAGSDLTEFEIQLVEQKREAAKKKKAMLSGLKLVTEPTAHEEPAMETIAEAQEEASPAVDTAPTVPVTQETEVVANGGETAEAAENAEAPDTRPIHENIICNLCMADPIKGIRYKCANAECPDFDMCEDCYAKKEHDQSHEMTVIPVPRNEQAVHTNYYCSMCHVQPIVGTRYKCLEEVCGDYDLCQNCMDTGDHPKSHSMWMLPLPIAEQEEGAPAPASEGAPEIVFGSQPIHEGIYCDGCRMPAIIGPRYKCMDASCPSYDLCESCVKKGIHPPNHQLLRLDAPEEAQHLHPGVTAGSPVILGLRVYTLKSSPATLGGQLKHGTLRNLTKP